MSYLQKIKYLLLYYYYLSTANITSKAYKHYSYFNISLPIFLYYGYKRPYNYSICIDMTALTVLQVVLT